MRSIRIILYLSLATSIVYALLAQMVKLRITDQDYYEMFENQLPDSEFSIRFDSTYQKKIRYVRVEGDTKTALILLHGSPAFSSKWVPFLLDTGLLRSATLIAPDRPGYGYSDFGNPMTSAREQAHYLAPILEKLQAEFKKVYLFGSSYGGTVAASLAMENPELIDGIIFLSSSTKAGAEKTYWISYPASHPLLKWIVPESLRVANAEKLGQYSSLKRGFLA